MIRARGSGWWLSATLLLTSVLMRKPPGRETQPQWAALRANYDDRYITVGEHFDCFATEHDRRDAAAAVGGHHNCVAFSLSRRIVNRLVGCACSTCTTSQATPAAAAASVATLRYFAVRAATRFLYSSGVSVTMLGSTAKI